MENEVIHEPDLHRYSVTVEGVDEPAILQYSIIKTDEGEMYDLTHTYVHPAMRGKGIASKLVKKACEHARQNQHKIIPSCSYVETYFSRHPDDVDVVQKE